MSLLLCRTGAGVPFYMEKADIKLYSLQELCYFVYNYPLVMADDPVSDELVAWIKDGLSMGILAERLSRLKESGETVENLLYLILREGNYYSIEEINEFKQRLGEYLRLPYESLLPMKAASFFRLGRYCEAGELFKSAASLIREKIKRSVTEDRKAEQYKLLSELICDEAVCRIRLFDDDGARELLRESIKTADNERCREYLWLLDENAGGEFISEEKRSELAARREEAAHAALGNPGYLRVAAIFDKDSVKQKEETGKLVAEWKSTYRKMI